MASTPLEQMFTAMVNVLMCSDDDDNAVLYQIPVLVLGCLLIEVVSGKKVFEAVVDEKEAGHQKLYRRPRIPVCHVLAVCI